MRAISSAEKGTLKRGDRPRFLLAFLATQVICSLMPKRARIIVPNIPLHIIQRENNRQACFFAEEDYLFYLDSG